VRKTAVYQFASRGVDLLVGEISASRAERGSLDHPAPSDATPLQRAAATPRAAPAAKSHEPAGLPEVAETRHCFKVTTMSL